MLWDAETGVCEATLEGHGVSVTSCAFSPDGRRLVSGGGRSLRLWDPDSMCEVYRLPTLYGVECVAVHPTRPRLAFGDGAGIVSVVDLHGTGWGGAEGAALSPVRAATPSGRTGTWPDPRETGSRDERRGWRRVLPHARG